MQSKTRKLDRRAVLTGSAASAAAMAVTTMPAPASTIESARDTIRRAGKEIAEALNHYDNGKWHAFIYPSKHVKDGLWLGQRMNYRSLDVEPELVALEAKWRKAREAERRAAEALSEAEGQYFATRPNFEARPTPDHLLQAQRDMRVCDLSDKSHPVNVELAAFFAEEEERRAAWEAEDERFERESGKAKVEARHHRAIARTNRAFDAVMEHPAKTIDGLRLKVRVIEEHCRYDDLDRDAWEAVAADIIRGVTGPGELS